MTSLPAVMVVAEKVESLLLAEGAPARCAGSLRDNITELRSEIVRLGQLLWVADARKCITEEIKEIVTGLIYQIEDAIELCAKQEAAREGKLFRCVFKSTTTEMILKVCVSEFRSKINDISETLSFLNEGSSIDDGIVPSSDASPQRRRTTSPRNELILSRDKDIERLKSFLVRSEPSKLSVVSICGMGGVGKTTLARSLYNDSLVMNNFENRAWSIVGQEFQSKKILKSILSSFMRMDYMTVELETMELMERLYKAQKGKRYLIVLDDVWSTEVLDDLQVAFPDDNNGSRVIITTRLLNVARYSASYVHRMRLLIHQESNELAPEVDTTSDIVRGNQYFVPWEDILTQSYNELPFHLQPCLLYLGHFPPDQAIPVEKLYLLWMAEGLISLRDHVDRRKMEVAEDFLKELVYRSLVVVEEIDPVLSSKRINSCKLPDMIRGFCIERGKKNEYFQIIDFDSKSVWDTSTCRVAIYLHKYRGDTNDFLRISGRETHKIRSIFFYDADIKSESSSTWPKELSNLKEFIHTRVLHFDEVDFGVRKLPRGIEKLAYLRYLSFGGCNLPEFPVSLSNFLFMETLDLRVKVSCIINIPNVLRKLSSLRHLYLPVAYRSGTKNKLKLDSLKKLEILENFHASICDADDLLQMKNLEIFKGTVDGNTVDLEKVIRSMNEMRSLHDSSLVVKEFDAYSKERRLIVRTLMNCNAIHRLNFEGYLGVFPWVYQGRISTLNFTELVLNGSELDENPLPVLGKLANLRRLVLCNDAFIGKKMMCSDGDFLGLVIFKVATLQYLEELEMGEGMMNLTTFIVEQCDKLKMDLHQLKGRNTIRKLMVGSMPDVFVNSVEEISEEVTVTIYDC